jgi:bifunctional DNA-binding transcriptional regulator/antitoxin component of YhaV-PrlF toxin-antitoxin module
VRVNSKGQILILKIFRNRYGVEEGGQAVMDPTVEGLPVKNFFHALKWSLRRRRVEGFPRLKLPNIFKYDDG